MQETLHFINTESTEECISEKWSLEGQRQKKAKRQENGRDENRKGKEKRKLLFQKKSNTEKRDMEIKLG